MSATGLTNADSAATQLVPSQVPSAQQLPMASGQPVGRAVVISAVGTEHPAESSGPPDRSNPSPKLAADQITTAQNPPKPSGQPVDEAKVARVMDLANPAMCAEGPPGKGNDDTNIACYRLLEAQQHPNAAGLPENLMVATPKTNPENPTMEAVVQAGTSGSTTKTGWDQLLAAQKLPGAAGQALGEAIVAPATGIDSPVLGCGSPTSGENTGTVEPSAPGTPASIVQNDLLERFGVLFEQYRGDSLLAQFFEPVGLFFRCSVAVVNGLLSQKRFAEYSASAIPYSVLLVLLYAGHALALSTIRPYIDTVQTVKEAVAAWLSAVAYLLILLKLIQKVERYDIAIGVFVVAALAVQVLAVVGVALLKLLLVRRLVPQVEEAVEQYVIEREKAADASTKIPTIQWETTANLQQLKHHVWGEAGIVSRILALIAGSQQKQANRLVIEDVGDVKDVPKQAPSIWTLLMFQRVANEQRKLEPISEPIPMTLVEELVGEVQQTVEPEEQEVVQLEEEQLKEVSGNNSPYLETMGVAKVRKPKPKKKWAATSDWKL